MHSAMFLFKLIGPALGINYLSFSWYSIEATRDFQCRINGYTTECPSPITPTFVSAYE